MVDATEPLYLILTGEGRGLYTKGMLHIHTQPGQHDHTVSAYIIRYINDEPYLLLHRHKK